VRGSRSPLSPFAVVVQVIKEADDAETGDILTRRMQYHVKQ
jgi:hypothetical protein